MDRHERRLPGAGREDGIQGAREALNEAGALLRRLIPLQGPDAPAPLSLMSARAPAGGPPANPVTGVLPAGQQAASIVSQAASILDEEMARGVLAAREAAPAIPSARPGAGHPVLRQIHELVDNIGAAWPTLQNAWAQAALPEAAASAVDPLAELSPRTTVRRGERATISMTLSNTEGRSVRLVPAATDLLGSRGGKIAASLIEFTPSESSLGPEDRRDLTLAMTVPDDAAPGCYSGLLVVRGVDYLRALITIEVV